MFRQSGSLDANFRDGSGFPEAAFAYRADCIQPMRRRSLVINQCSVFVDIYAKKETVGTCESLYDQAGNERFIDASAIGF